MPFLGKTPTKLLDANVNIDGGNIDGTTIGASSTAPATVSTFTSTGIDDNATSTAITIDSGGNVTIDGSDASTSLASTAILNLKAGDANNEYSILRFATSADGSIAYIGAKATTTGAYPSSVGNLEFGVQNGASTVTAMTINNSGLVGIGTDSPADELHVNAVSANVNMRLTRDTDTGARISGSDGASTPVIKFDTIASGTATERMRIDQNGNVGVGTDSPTAVSGGVVVEAESATGAEFIAGNSTQGTSGGELIGGYLFKNSDTSATDPHYAGIVGKAADQFGFIDLEFYAGRDTYETSGTPHLFIDGGNTNLGNVGIGTTSPSNPLNVIATNTNVLIEGSGVSSTGIAFETNNTTRASIGVANASTALSFFSDAGSTETMRILSNGNVSIGTTGDEGRLAVYNTGSAGSSSRIAIGSGNTGTCDIFFDDTDANNRGVIRYDHSSDFMSVWSGGAERMRIDSSGDVSIGTTSCDFQSANRKILQVEGTTDAILNLSDGTSHFYLHQRGGTTGIDIWNAANSFMRFATNNTEAMRITSSGNFIVGDTTAGNAKVTSVNSIAFEARDSAKPYYQWYNSGAGTDLKYWRVGNGTDGSMDWQTVNDAYSSATVRMKLDSSGNLLVGMETLSTSDSGVQIKADGLVRSNRSGGQPLILNRTTNDGTLVSLLQDGSTEGTISVSGTTVSYNGGHLSRWSQSDTDDVSAIYKGTVMSNLDEMCEWDNEDNEQLNKTKVSDVEGDVNVAGVFVAEDSSDDLSDYYLAMTGDMIIRIAQGTTVQRGALLMSAGDGTAKPQDDDIVRSKTIAKVTSTNVTCTYADGSYCVPCVVMAC